MVFGKYLAFHPVFPLYDPNPPISIHSIPGNPKQEISTSGPLLGDSQYSHASFVENQKIVCKFYKYASRQLIKVLMRSLLKIKAYIVSFTNMLEVTDRLESHVFEKQKYLLDNNISKLEIAGKPTLLNSNL